MTFPALLLRLNALGATGFSGVLVSLPEPPHAQTITLVSAYKSVIATLRACMSLGSFDRLMLVLSGRVGIAHGALAL